MYGAFKYGQITSIGGRIIPANGEIKILGENIPLLDLLYFGNGEIKISESNKISKVIITYKKPFTGNIKLLGNNKGIIDFENPISIGKISIFGENQDIVLDIIEKNDGLISLIGTNLVEKIDIINNPFTGNIILSGTNIPVFDRWIDSEELNDIWKDVEDKINIWVETEHKNNIWR